MFNRKNVVYSLSMKIKLTKIESFKTRLSSDEFPVGTILIGEINGQIEVDRTIFLRDWTKPFYATSAICLGIVLEITGKNSFITRSSRYKWEEVNESDTIPIYRNEPEELPDFSEESGLIIQGSEDGQDDLYSDDGYEAE